MVYKHHYLLLLRKQTVHQNVHDIDIQISGKYLFFQSSKIQKSFYFQAHL